MWRLNLKKEINILFLLHPITLGCAAVLWPIIQEVSVYPWKYDWLNHPLFYRWFFYTQSAIITLFFIYQIVFWNFIWNRREIVKQ